ncbi:MAG: methyltransferase domain-containing protein [Alphaproteobacteria bacterium]|nr:methyltransferase domain-containing protein [Alphaproteobacteria bacterium]
MVEESPFKPEHLARVDEAEDELFYQIPRMVRHLDDPGCRALTAFYDEILPEGGAILDLMSSAFSHLPEDKHFSRVVGHGMNEKELKANTQLSEHFCQNLNKDPKLPFADESFDGAVCALSIQYLQDAPAVFAEVGRVLKKGAPFAVSYSNRMFPTKAIALWRALDDADRALLIDMYFRLSGAFEEERDMKNLSPNPGQTDPVYVITGTRA